MKHILLCTTSKIVYKLYLFFYGICHKLERLHYRIYVQIFREDEVNNGMTSEFTENTPHEVAELICLNCHSRAIHVYPVETLLKDLQCKCGATGLLIKTGQTLHTSPTDLCNRCKLCVENSCKIHITPVDDYCGYFSEVDNGNN